MIKKVLFFLIYLLNNSYLAIYSQNTIIISKDNFALYVINNRSDTLFSAPVGLGTNYGSKTRRGDKKTPEGVFTISQIQNSNNWTHDFKDGYGERKGAYGPWFFRLKVPKNSSIGIHGTCFPNSIGTRCSEGCIRMRNEDIVKLRKYIKVGMRCVILSDSSKSDER